MFDSKKTKLEGFGTKSTATSVSNSFLNAGMKQTVTTRSENGSLKYSTTGDDFVDQFSKIGEYKVPRTFDKISADMQLLWSQNKQLALAFNVYLRLISRSTVVLGTKLPVQNGAGLRHESIMRMIWLSQNAPEAFYQNLVIFVSAGSWQDFFKMLQYDLVHHGWNGRVLDWNKMGNLLLNCLEKDSEVNLIKKYLPQIKATSKCKTVEAQADTLIAKWVCSLLFGNKTNGKNTSYVQYRKLKNSGNAHEWQKIISQRQFDRLDFDKIHGRALKSLVNSKFLANQGLTERYEKFITNPNVSEVKFTGFVHELFESINAKRNDRIKLETINKQFNRLVSQAKDEEKFSNLMVVRDTSGSMGYQAGGTNMTCYDLAKSLGLYMSEFLSGPFANHWIEFNSTAKMHEWKGSTATDKWFNDRSNYVGSTNFQSVIDLFCNLKKQGFAKEEDFPRGIICISDTEFNPSQLGKTNVETARQKLRNAGFSNEYANDFIIVLWNVYRKQSFKAETYGFAPNTFYYSGFDASTIALLTGSNVKTARDLFNEAMSQDIMHYLKVK